MFLKKAHMYHHFVTNQTSKQSALKEEKRKKVKS